MLMDFFFKYVFVEKKCCVYFYEFMLDVYVCIVEWCKLKLGQCKCCLEFVKLVGDDLILLVVCVLVCDVKLFCFDEFQVIDIVDVMILGCLFEVMFDEGIVVVLMFNWYLDMLYKDGINWQFFLFFIVFF